MRGIVKDLCNMNRDSVKKVRDKNEKKKDNRNKFCLYNWYSKGELSINEKVIIIGYFYLRCKGIYEIFVINRIK